MKPFHYLGQRMGLLSPATVKKRLYSMARPNTAVKAAPSGRWTLRDKAPRSAPYL